MLDPKPANLHFERCLSILKTFILQCALLSYVKATTTLKGIAAIAVVGGIAANLVDMHYTGKRFLELREQRPELRQDQRFWNQEGRFIGRYAYDVDSLKWMIPFYTITKNRAFDSYEKPLEYN